MTMKQAWIIIGGAAALMLVIVVVGGVAGLWDPSEEPAVEGAEAPDRSSPKAALSLSDEQLKSAIYAKLEAFVGAHSLALGEVEVEVEKANVKVVVNLAFPTPPMDRSTNEKIVHAAVKLTLDALMAAGHDPHEEGIYASAYAYQPMGKRSPTGRKLVRTHASASYNYARDRIEVKEFRP